MFHFVLKRVSEALKKFYKRLLDLEGDCLIIWKVRFAGNIGTRKYLTKITINKQITINKVS
jgi:hypothetical protein